MRYLSLVILLFITGCTTTDQDEKAQEEIQEEIQEEVQFADPNLEAAIRNAIGKPSGSILEPDLERLGIECENITDLSGLEYCINLQVLYECHYYESHLLHPGQQDPLYFTAPQ